MYDKIINFHDWYATTRSSCEAQSVPCFSKETEAFLKDLIQNNKPKYGLEIGCAWGLSLITTAQLMSQWGGMIQGLERSEPNVKEIQNSIQRLGMNNVVIHHCNAVQTGRECNFTQKLDRAFIDGAKGQYVDYLHTILPMMAENGLIVFDDVIKFDYKLTTLYIYLEKNQISYQVHRLGDGDGVLVIDCKDLYNKQKTI